MKNRLLSPRAGWSSIFRALPSALVFAFVGTAVALAGTPLEALPDTGSPTVDGEPPFETVDVPSATSGDSARRFAVSSRVFSWYDAARRRRVPLKIFYPATSVAEKLPVVVFSHGLGGSFDCCSYLGAAWASRGYAVVLIQHPGSDENVWKGKVRILNELREAYRFHWSGRSRAGDIRFVLDRLEILADEGHRLASRFDFDRVGVGGYDLGALASLLVAGQIPPDGGPSLRDPRVKAVLAMSPPINRPRGTFRDVYERVESPVFFISGTEDDGVVGSTKAYQRRIPFDAMSGNNRYLVVFHGADHRIYGGRFLSIRARNDKPFQAAIVRTSSFFWQAVLRDDPTAQSVLDGYGLNSLAGGLARIERRIETTTFVPEEVPNPAPPSDRTVSRDATDAEKAVDASEKTDAIEFPITRYYRSLVSKYDNEPSVL